MYNPDVLINSETFEHVDSPEISASPDRQEKLNLFCNLISEKLGWGVTRRGDRITVRSYDDSNKLFDIHMTVLEVGLDRDIDRTIPQ